MNNPKLARFIKSAKGDKVDMVVTSLNLEKKHIQFLKDNNVNVSQLVREYIDSLMADPK